MLDVSVNSPISFEWSCFEIYNEHIRDLMQLGDNTELKVVESNNNFECVNLSKIPFSNKPQFQKLLNKAYINRKQAHTYLAHLSSRSHVIYQVKLFKDNERISTVTFVDLAGSENIKELIDTNSAIEVGSMGYDSCKNRSGKKERVKEGKFINKSLFFLDQVLKKLIGLTERKELSLRDLQIHIPFRSTNLTKILKACLLGNSSTRLVVC